MELQIIKQEMPVINFNFEEMKENLKTNLEKYQNLIVTDETLEGVKKIQKELSKTKNTVDSYRKKIKKEVKKPIDVFESQCKELTGLIIEVEEPLKEGIKVFADKVREEKRVKIVDFINEKVAEAELIEKYACKVDVLDRYLNVSSTLKSVKEDIESNIFLFKQSQTREQEFKKAILSQIESVNTLYNLDSKLTKDDFRSILNNENVVISDAIAEINRIAQSRKDVEDRAKKREEERIKAEALRIEQEKIAEQKRLDAKRITEEIRLQQEKELEEQKLEVEKNTIVEEPVVVLEPPIYEPPTQSFVEPEPVDLFENIVEPVKKGVCYRILADETQLDGLRDYMFMNEIAFEKVEV